MRTPANSQISPDHPNSLTCQYNKRRHAGNTLENCSNSSSVLKLRIPAETHTPTPSRLLSAYLGSSCRGGSPGPCARREAARARSSTSPSDANDPNNPNSIPPMNLLTCTEGNRPDLAGMLRAELLQRARRALEVLGLGVTIIVSISSSLRSSSRRSRAWAEAGSQVCPRRRPACRWALLSFYIIMYFDIPSSVSCRNHASFRRTYIRTLNHTHAQVSAIEQLPGSVLGLQRWVTDEVALICNYHIALFRDLFDIS